MLDASVPLSRREAHARRLPLLDDALQDRERLPDLPDLRLQVLAPSDLTDHDGHERRVVPPRPQQDLGNALELLRRGLVRVFDGAKAPDELTPVLDEDRAQHLVLRGEVVVEKTVRDARILGDVADPRTVVAVIGEDAYRSVENELPLVRGSD